MFPGFMRNLALKKRGAVGGGGCEHVIHLCHYFLFFMTFGLASL